MELSSITICYLIFLGAFSQGIMLRIMSKLSIFLEKRREKERRKNLGEEKVLIYITLHETVYLVAPYQLE